MLFMIAEDLCQLEQDSPLQRLHPYRTGLIFGHANTLPLRRILSIKLVTAPFETVCTGSLSLNDASELL